MSYDWGKIMMPVIKNISPEFAAKEFVSVQPMTYDGPPSYMESIDLANPRVGVIHHDEDKNPEPNRPPLCGCCRDYWGKVYTPKGWILEKEHPRLYAAACKKYGPKYKALIERERRAWNKKHGIKKRFGMNMVFVHDSSKQQG